MIYGEVTSTDPLMVRPKPGVLAIGPCRQLSTAGDLSIGDTVLVTNTGPSAAPRPVVVGKVGGGGPIPVETVLGYHPADGNLFFTNSWETPTRIASGEFVVNRLDFNGEFTMRVNTHMIVQGGGGALLRLVLSDLDGSNPVDYIIGAYGGEERGDVAGVAVISGHQVGDNIAWRLEVQALLSIGTTLIEISGLDARSLCTNWYSPYVFCTSGSTLLWLSPGRRPGFTIPGGVFDPNGNPGTLSPVVTSSPIPIGAGPHRTAMAPDPVILDSPHNGDFSLIGILNFGAGTVSIGANSVQQTPAIADVFLLGTTGALFTPDTSSPTPNGALAWLPDPMVTQPNVLCIGVGSQIRLISVDISGGITPGTPLTLTGGDPITELAINYTGSRYDGWAATANGLYPFSIAADKTTITTYGYFPTTSSGHSISALAPLGYGNSYTFGVGGNSPAVIALGTTVAYVNHPAEGGTMVSTSFTPLPAILQGDTPAEILQILPGTPGASQISTTWLVVSLAGGGVAIQTIGNGEFGNPIGQPLGDLGIIDSWAGVVSMYRTNDVLSANHFGQLVIDHGALIGIIGDLPWNEIEPSSFHGLNGEANVWAQGVNAVGQSGPFFIDYGWHSVVVTCDAAESAFGDLPPTSGPDVLWLEFPFDHTVGPSGITVTFDSWTPQPGDMIIDAWIQVPTAFDGTTPRADFAVTGTVTSGGNGVFRHWNIGAWGLTGTDANVAGFTGPAGTSGPINAALEYLGAILDVPSGEAATLTLWISEGGQYQGVDAGCTVGQGVLRLQVLRGAAWKS